MARRCRAAGAGARGRLPLDEAAAKALLQRYGIRVPRAVVCATRQAALAAFATLPLPVVVKVLNPAIVHKTDVGGVFLNVRTEAELTAALDAIDRIPAPARSQYLIEETARPGVELIVGGLNDASFGPAVMVGMGGVLAQAIKDTALRLAPLGRDDALEMLASLKSAAVLDGWRGAPAVDKAALADAIVGVGRMMAEHPEIAELDINPLRASADGCVALDAVVLRCRRVSEVAPHDRCRMTRHVFRAVARERSDCYSTAQRPQHGQAALQETLHHLAGHRPLLGRVGHRPAVALHDAAAALQPGQHRRGQAIHVRGTPCKQIADHQRLEQIDLQRTSRSAGRPAAAVRRHARSRRAMA